MYILKHIHVHQPSNDILGSYASFVDHSSLIGKINGNVIVILYVSIKISYIGHILLSNYDMMTTYMMFWISTRSSYIFGDYYADTQARIYIVRSLALQI